MGLDNPANAQVSTSQMVGLLFMAYGSPESLEQMEAYLLDVREGRPPSKDLVTEISERYAQIGGQSPLMCWTEAQAHAVAEELNRRHATRQIGFKGYVGMRHWEPRIKEAVHDMVVDGIKKAVSLVMAPHSSQLSVGKYYERLDESLAEYDTPIEFARIQHWHDHPALIAAIAENAFQALQRFAPGDEPFIVFTAHSLPARILEMGDPYDDQLRETACLLAERMNLTNGRWQFCYQSAGASQVPWLGPQIEEVIPELALAGQDRILIIPIGFVSDHVEVLYDIDINCRQIAKSLGIQLERSDSLNTQPTFINAIADLVSDSLPKLNLT